jgi:hypothetical protein
VTSTILEDDYDYDEDMFAPDYTAIPKLPRIALWPQHLYRGTATMFAGHQGTGKGMTGVHCAAVVTRGGLFPGEKDDSRPDRIPGSVLGVWPEDDPNEDLAYRLDAALAGEGADTRHVYDMTETIDGEPFDLNNGGHDSVARLRAAIAFLADCDGTEGGDCPCGNGGDEATGRKSHSAPRWPVLLVIVDPLLSVTETVGTNRSARRTMAPLMRLLKETGVAGLIIHHTVKDGKIAGSKGLTDVLRLIFTINREEPGSDVVVLAMEKANNIGKVGDLRYKIAGTEEEPYVEWTTAAKTGPAATPDWRQRDNARMANTLLRAVVR